ncbi:PREDICTED: very-long-chain 3-oxoacyl-CoA reductase-B-like [Priapulus caudatus]|uniref:Very-long-chain 3-oxoacyl-CoA reductase-B-like n=1 Tax=Priapulus caudatus TaxID=37621 RepID=A0ABM1EUL7_PRICU|nr:PREDICTED: very-long-chain 3-oxoacyl-CoA reductase-B-like [Priapulus caudatus]
MDTAPAAAAAAAAAAGGVCVCTYVFAVIGVVCSAYVALSCLRFVCRLVKVYALSRPLHLYADLSKMGSWAVVTGATDGIGKQYALQLAEQGLNIVLIGRSPEKLKATESEVRMRSNVQVKTVVVDYSGGREIYDDVERELAGLEIGVLVNNVGMGYAWIFDEFLDVERDVHLRMLNVNMMSCVAMTFIVLPQVSKGGGWGGGGMRGRGEWRRVEDRGRDGGMGK